MWVLLQDFLSTPVSASEMAQRLEQAAARDFGGSR
jgi:hypothetical protein